MYSDPSLILGFAVRAINRYGNQSTKVMRPPSLLFCIDWVCSDNRDDIGLDQILAFGLYPSWK
jgi:hypothetical protein